MHLDLSVASLEELLDQHERVLALGGRLLSNRDRPDPDDEERFRVYRDPQGHPFCIFVVEREA
ncbi:VOC family protein [Streptomyces sp. enrichment culture]